MDSSTLNRNQTKHPCRNWVCFCKGNRDNYISKTHFTNFLHPHEQLYVNINLNKKVCWRRVFIESRFICILEPFFLYQSGQ